MAGAGYKLFNTGDVLTAAQVNTYLQEQAVMRFANATARTTALSGVLAEGMVSYLDDTNTLEVYNGTAWVGATGDITEVQAGVGISIASGTGPIPVITNSSTDLVTTAGDILYGTAADTMARLGIGTAGQVLKVNSGATAPEWGAAPSSAFVGCALSKSGTQNVTNTTDTAITFDTEQFDTNTFHDNSTNTSRITIPAGYGGKYLFTAKLSSQGVQAGGSYRNLSLRKNGTVIAYFQNWSSGAGFPASNVTWETQGTQILNLVATDYIEMFWYQDSGATNTIASGTTTTTFQCVYLGA